MDEAHFLSMTTLTDPRTQPQPPQTARIEAAVESCQRILQANPDDPGALHRLGLLAAETGQMEDAVALISHSLSVRGENVAAICDLAAILQKMGRQEEALDFYRAATETAPRQAAVHEKLGAALRAAGELDEALACYRRATELEPKSAVAHANLGSVFQLKGDYFQAIGSLRKASRLAPDSPQIAGNLGAVLLQAGRCEEAVRVLSGLPRAKQSAGVLSNLSAAYNSLGQPAKAEQAAWEALKLDPQFTNALNNLGNALKAQGQYQQAIACFAKARELQPQCHLAYNNLGATLSEMGRTAEALEGLRLAQQLHPHSAAIFSNYLLTLNYQTGIPPETIYAEHRRFDKQIAQPLAISPAPHENQRDPQRRLRVGYVSADFRDHPVANFFEPMLAVHSPAEVEVFCYANQTVSDAVTKRLRGHAHHWHEVSVLTDEELCAQIRRDEIDILVDLSGHTAGNRLPAFARKPAPVQVSMIGYMQTTGMSTMDYRITDENLNPTGSSEAFSSERLVRLAAGAATFCPPVDCPPVNDLPSLEIGHVTFASFNNLAKVTPEVLAAWAEILRGLPSARLLVVGRGGGPAQEILLAAGIEPERLEFLERLPMAEYLALHHRVDVVLDTFPYNGGTTTLLAAWMGVPFITLAGPGSTGRAGVNLLRGLGLAELSANDPAEYVQHALAAAGDLPRLAIWRRELRSRLSPLLGDGTAYTRELEAAFRTMWREWCARAA